MVKLRKATEKDCKLIWKWANDPQVRVVSFSSDFIPYEKHAKWFTSKLKDSNCRFFIAENDNREPIGQVRFDFEGNEATISISLDRNFRYKDYGSKLIELASKKIFEVSCVDKIHAYIKKQNTVSVKVFIKGGFKVFENTAIGEHQATHLICKKEDQS